MAGTNRIAAGNGSQPVMERGHKMNPVWRLIPSPDGLGADPDRDPIWMDDR